MTATDMVGGIIDRLMERRYGAPLSEKWWAREHAHHQNYMVTLDCPHCPTAENLAEQMHSGRQPLLPMSYNDVLAVDRAMSRDAAERMGRAIG